MPVIADNNVKMMKAWKKQCLVIAIISKCREWNARNGQIPSITFLSFGQIV